MLNFIFYDNICIKNSKIGINKVGIISAITKNYHNQNNKAEDKDLCTEKKNV